MTKMMKPFDSYFLAFIYCSKIYWRLGAHKYYYEIQIWGNQERWIRNKDKEGERMSEREKKLPVNL